MEGLQNQEGGHQLRSGTKSSKGRKDELLTVTGKGLPPCGKPHICKNAVYDSEIDRRGQS